MVGVWSRASDRPAREKSRASDRGSDWPASTEHGLGRMPLVGTRSVSGPSRALNDHSSERG
jgi:hypothetical protein